jgi:5-(carboxyamino)imidazole ribonucleotide mutase
MDYYRLLENSYVWLLDFMTGRVVVIMGSDRDLDFSREIGKYLKLFGVEYEFRVASAHKTPEKVLEILRASEDEKVVYVTVAGRSNALSGFVDANTSKPVVACPPTSQTFGGADIFSSLRMPSGVGCVVTVEPEGAAIAAAKILALENKELELRVTDYQLRKKREVENADETVKKLK